MTLNKFLDQINNQAEIDFADTLAVIAENYTYQPCEFSNGLHPDMLINSSGTNEGSCKTFAFAKIHQLNQQQTLQLFGDYYRQILQDPAGDDHQNIRHFLKYGWQGIRFTSMPLTVKSEK